MQPTNNSALSTPVYLKEVGDETLPDDPISYLITGNGPFLNRTNSLFSASVPCRYPSELPRHEAILDWKQPIPRELIETIVGFFYMINSRHPGAEAVVLLGWDQSHGYEVIVPKQKATIARHPFGAPSPVRVQYDIPALPPGMVIAASLHSHAYIEAFESNLDHWDTEYKAGLHITVGKIDRAVEPPDLFAVAVVDGFRFVISNPMELFTDYKTRRTDFPEQWYSHCSIHEISTLTSHMPYQGLVSPKRSRTP